MTKDASVFLAHIVEYAGYVEQFLEGVDEERFLEDKEK